MIGKAPVYIINLRNRRERKDFVCLEFQGRTEFNIYLVEAKKNKIGSIGLWNTIKHILQNLISKKDEFIILCEDDHQFTNEYSKERLFQCIEEAKSMDADILSGGISSFTSALQVSENLYWIEKFSGLQFTVIFGKFFKTILEADFGPGDAADYKICSLTDNKFLIYPFISVQKDFGYSDVTPKNNMNGRIDKLFKDSKTKIRLLKKVFTFYKKNTLKWKESIDFSAWKNIAIPTYVINLPEKTNQKVHILEQFKGKDEFDVHIVETCKHKIETIKLWLSIRSIIETAIKNKDDVIIICGDDHEFTNNYSKSYLMQSIVEAHERGADLLSGGTTGFETALPITDNMFWVNQYLSIQFIVIYKKFFEKILNEPFNDNVAPNKLLSEITSNKMVIYPFISVRGGVECLDSILNRNKVAEFTEETIISSSRKLEVIRKIYLKLGLKYYDFK